MLPNFYDLKYFLEIAKTLNISRAAERLGVAQPSLSTALKRLEEILGTELLVRSKTGVHLTAEGKAFEARARDLLISWDELTRTLHKSSVEPSGRFVIGAHASIALYSTPHFLPAMLERYSKLELKFVHGLSRKVVEKVITFEIDAGLVVNPIRHPDLVLTELGQDDVTFWISPSSKPAARKILFCDLDLAQSHVVLKKAEKQGLRFDRLVESSSLEWICAAALDGLGTALLPGRVAQRSAENSLVRYSEKAPVYRDSLNLVYRADHLKSPATKKVIKEIVSGMRSSFR